jgi:C-terminal processing protease CtpA/Prc
MVSMIRTPLLFSVTLVLVAGGALPAQQREIVVRRAPRAEGSDSTERQLRRLERIADSLSRMFNDEERSAAERRSIGESLDRTVQQIQELALRAAEFDGTPRGRIELRGMLAPEPNDRASTMMGRAYVQAGSFKSAMPRGWVGIVLSGPALEPRINKGELFIRYLSHPEIVSVEPGGPAERAGIAPHDTLIAYDGHDVSASEIPITRLLRPNARVMVRFRRNGRTREVPVTIADVPSRISLRTEMNAEMMAPRGEGGFADAGAFPRMAPPPPRYGPGMRVPAAAAAPLAPSTPLPSQAPTPGIILGYGYNSVAGAQFAVVTEGLARAIGVPQGVLVTLAPPGSLAYQSGLREGDVVVKVEGAPIRTIAELRERVQAAAENGDSAVELEYLREKRARKAVLRWNGPR